MIFYAGVDGGGTRSTVVVTDAGGRERARVSGGPMVVRPGAGEERAAALAELVAAGARAAEAEAARAAGVAGAAGVAAGAEATPPELAALCCALTGAGRPAEQQALRAALLARGVAARVSVVADAEAALEDGLGGEAGILLIAGTGSIAWARRPDGERLRVGGWGPRLGDEGSGWALGLAALRAVARAADGRGPGTALTEAALAHAGVAEPAALIGWAQAASKAEVAALAPLVARVAAAGDGVARALLAGAADELAELVLTAERRGGPWPGAAPLALSGGLLGAGAPLRQPLLDALSAARAPVAVRSRDVDPARGAAALARRLP